MDLNVKWNTTKLLEENIGEVLGDHETGDEFQTVMGYIESPRIHVKVLFPSTSEYGLI